MVAEMVARAPGRGAAIVTTRVTAPPKPAGIVYISDVDPPTSTKRSEAYRDEILAGC